MLKYGHFEMNDHQQCKNKRVNLQFLTMVGFSHAAFHQNLKFPKRQTSSASFFDRGQEQSFLMEVVFCSTAVASC